MQRVTITLDDDLIAALDTFMRGRQHGNRSEAIRDLVRSGLQELGETQPSADGDCVGALVYVYDHETRHLPQRLTNTQHDHHDISVATMHVHLDHESCLEVAVLRGPGAQVKHFADHVTAERGVRYGRLVTVPVDAQERQHAHGGARHPHVHHRPR